MLLEVKNVFKSFGEKEVLKDISFKVESGRAMGFLGRNGSGKTTTIRCIMDIFKPNSGEIFLDGKKFDPKKNKVGYLPEERGMYAKEVILDQLIYFAKLKGATYSQAKESAKYWLNRFGLSEYENKKLETLSKGNQQKVQIIQAFLHNPDIIILDEPFSGLDPVNAELFKDAIRDSIKDGKLVVFSSHQMGYVEEFCDDITLIHEGRVMLSENLEELKERLGFGKFRLESKNFTNDELRAILLEKFKDLNIESDNKSLIISLDKVSEKEFLEYLLSKDVRIKVFSIYTPSLQDIFIMEVGKNE